MQIKTIDVLHFYIGQTVTINRPNVRVFKSKLTALALSSIRADDSLERGARGVRLNLLPLEWISPEMVLEIGINVHPKYWKWINYTADCLTPTQVVKLCAHGYDLFNLIESGQADVLYKP